MGGGRAGQLNLCVETIICIYTDSFFEGTDIWPGGFRLGLSMCSKLKFLGQIVSFERRPRGAAPTPLALPYRFCTSM